MDPAGIGALIGFGLLFVCLLFLRICEIYEKRKKDSLTIPLLPTPVLNPIKNENILRKNVHWKFNSLPVPKSLEKPIPTLILSSTTSYSKV